MGDVRGIASVAGQFYAFPAAGGLGLVLLAGHWTLVRFSCPLESLPPRGAGTIVGQTFVLDVLDGVLHHRGEAVHTGVPLDGQLFRAAGG